MTSDNQGAIIDSAFVQCFHIEKFLKTLSRALGVKKFSIWNSKFVWKFAFFKKTCFIKNEFFNG